MYLVAEVLQNTNSSRSAVNKNDAADSVWI